MTRLRNTAAAATALVAAAAFLLLAPARAQSPPDGSPPSGALAGLRSPASSTLQLLLYASDSGVGLANAEATLDDQSAFARLGTGSCPEHPSPGSSAEPPPGECPASVSAVPLALDTGSVADGSHQLTVRVTDAAANTATLVDRTIAVRNAVPVTGSVASVTIGVASKSAGDSGGGGGKGGGRPPCRQPKLRMRLAQRPLWRTRPGRLPVLRFRRLHLYRGHLSCILDGKRVSAPDGARVEIFYRIWRRSFRKRRGPITVKKGAIGVRDGRLQVRLGFLSGRTIIFRYRSPGGGEARSKLRIAIARTDPPRQGQ
jgi:hypothetical protein